jgi:hypothetical protein
MDDVLDGEGVVVVKSAGRMRRQVDNIKINHSKTHCDSMMNQQMYN